MMTYLKMTSKIWLCLFVWITLAFNHHTVVVAFDVEACEACTGNGYFYCESMTKTFDNGEPLALCTNDTQAVAQYGSCENDDPMHPNDSYWNYKTNVKATCKILDNPGALVGIALFWIILLCACCCGGIGVSIYCCCCRNKNKSSQPVLYNTNPRGSTELTNVPPMATATATAFVDNPEAGGTGYSDQPVAAGKEMA